MSTDESKAGWRRWARERRRSLDLSAISGHIVTALRDAGTVAGGRRVLLYDPLPDEVDVTPLAAGCIALLTRTPPEGGLTVHAFDAPRERHPYGFSQPAAGASEVPLDEVDVVLVPGLAFDRSGTRLGRGAGYYDELLARLPPGALRVGVTPAALVVDRLPRADHDVPMTHLATEAGVSAAGSVGGMNDADILLQRARAWIDADPDPETRAELQAIIDAGDLDELRERMGATLEFGTAGIRGRVGAGSGRMNRAVVIRTTKGLADYLGAVRDEPAPVVVGFDGRLSSRRFAGDTVGVLTAAGFPVRYFATPTPTPLVAFAATEYGATAAVVVTASHNPPADNGYKVYDANGAQIVPPVDAAIAEAIGATGPANRVSRHEWMPGEKQLLAEAIGADVPARYVEAVMGLRPDLPADRDLKIVYTPLHGVGRAMTERLLATAGYGNVLAVPEQAEPDGRFPTVAFPNPEEPGALDLAMDLGTRVEADLILANDPDADRLAVCLPEDGGGWRALTGNQIGVLLADFVLENSDADRPLVINSVVSSPMLASIARAHEARFVQTLTGFKWIANAAMDLERDEGLDFVFGYEEALGYSVGPVVRDKDGMSAALWFADLVAHLRRRGKTVAGRLAGLYREHGLWVSTQRSVVRPGTEGLAEIAGAMESLASRVPSSLGGFAVTEAIDYREGAAERPRWLPEQALVALELGEAGRVLVRPSGTEPKLKIYVDRRASLGAEDDAAAREAEATGEAAAIAAEMEAFLGF